MTNLPEIIILPKNMVGMYLLMDEQRRRYYISIGDSDDPMPSSLTASNATADGIRLTFTDTRRESLTIDGVEYFGPTMNDIVQIDRFAKSIRHDRQACLLIHCQAGISRSSAAALVAMLSWNLAAEDAVRHLYRINPNAAPNGRMLDLMSRHHRLTPGLLAFLCAQEYKRISDDELWD